MWRHKWRPASRRLRSHSSAGCPRFLHLDGEPTVNPEMNIYSGPHDQRGRHWARRSGRDFPENLPDRIRDLRSGSTHDTHGHDERVAAHFPINLAAASSCGTEKPSTCLRAIPPHVAICAVVLSWLFRATLWVHVRATDLASNHPSVFRNHSYIRRLDIYSHTQ